MNAGDRVRVNWPTGIVETATVVSVSNTLPSEPGRAQLRMDDGTYCSAATAWLTLLAPVPQSYTVTAYDEAGEIVEQVQASTSAEIIRALATFPITLHVALEVA